MILLIDELETHLHYDAQADMVRMLDRQELAEQVIYSTHSAGCLPFDMGTGVAGVQPTDGVPFSSITRAFWTEGPGFSPLLMLMGATLAAFTPSRYALVGEGASEMIAMPTLIRQATGHDRLDYQVTSGVAEIATGELGELALAAARVAYLVDGDAGGRKHASRLESVGVPSSRIVALGGPNSGLTLEDLITPERYAEAASEVLSRQVGRRVEVPSQAVTGRPPRAHLLEAWCQAQSLPKPQKTRVAAMLVENRSALLTSAGRSTLIRAHRDITRALGIPNG
jgi:predicted ATP-dependent endonuclease of OLD family